MNTRQESRNLRENRLRDVAFLRNGYGFDDKHSSGNLSMGGGMGALVADLEHWPVFHFSINGTQTDEEIEQMIRVQKQADDRGEAFIVFAELGKFAPVMNHVKKLADRAKEHKISNELCRGCALVIKNQAARFLLSTYILVAPIKYPIEIFSEPEEALSWLRETAKKEGLSLPPSFSSEKLRAFEVPS